MKAFAVRIKGTNDYVVNKGYTTKKFPRLYSYLTGAINLKRVHETEHLELEIVTFELVEAHCYDVYQENDSEPDNRN